MARSGTLVTVVIPVFDGLPWLEETIASVAAQRGTRLQCIAVDDGSTDGSGDLLRRHGWTVLAMNRVGPNVARARALSVADGDLLAFLDQDDLWHPDHLATMAEALEGMPRAAAAIAPRVTFQGRHRPRLGGRRRGPDRFDPWAVYPVNLIDTPSMVVIRREALLEAGGWPADRVLGSDPLLWWRLSSRSPLAIGPRRTVGVRKSETSLSAVSRRRPLDYLDQLRVAAHDALANAPPGIDARLAARGDALLLAVSAVVAALMDGERVAAAAAAIEASLSDSSHETVVATLGFCGWLVAPHLRRRPPPGSDLVAAVIDAWPATAARTRAAVLRMMAAVVGPRRALSMALRLPLRAGHLSVAAAATAFALAGGLGRVADPLELHFHRRSPVGIPEPGA